jgi:hypothetical protein
VKGNFLCCLIIFVYIKSGSFNENFVRKFIIVNKMYKANFLVYNLLYLKTNELRKN